MSTLTLVACFALAGLVGWALLVAIDAACDVMEGAGRKVYSVHGVRREDDHLPGRLTRRRPARCSSQPEAQRARHLRLIAADGALPPVVRGALGRENRPAPRVVGNDAA